MQSVMFPGNVYSPNVVARYCVMFLRVQELKKRGFKLFQLLVFLVLSVTIPKLPWMMSSSANYRPFLRSFRHIPSQDCFVKLAN